MIKSLSLFLYKCIVFSKIFGGHESFFVGSLITLFWTSGEVCLGFKANSGGSKGQVRDACSRGPKFFDIHAVLWDNLGKLYVGDPLENCHPCLGEAWIRHCLQQCAFITRRPRVYNISQQRSLIKTDKLFLYSLSDFVSCRVIDTAAAQLTKTAIAVTAIFIVTMGYDNFYYVLGYTGVLNYKMNSPVQKIGTGIDFLH